MKLVRRVCILTQAGLVFLRTNMDFSLGISAIMAKAKYSYDGYSAKTDNPVGRRYTLTPGSRFTIIWLPESA